MEKGPIQARDGIDFDSYFSRFEKSENGDKFVGKIRWGNYRPAHVSLAAWQDLLGEDADMLSHMRSIHYLCADFIESDTSNSLKLTTEEKDYLLLAAASSLWGVENGGDTYYDQKTTEDEAKETAVFRAVYDIIVDDGLLNGDVQKMRFIIERILFDDKSKLGAIFNAVRRVRYVETALRAFQVSQKVDDPITKSHLQWLSAGVFSSQIIHLMNYSTDFEPVRLFLEKHSVEIDEVFSIINASIFAKNGEKQKAKHDAYDQARAAWERGASELTGTNNRHTSEQFDGGVFGDSSNFETRYFPDYNELLIKIQACRTLGLKVVLTSGSFDMIHIGHARYLEIAANHGDVLVVGVDSDRKIKDRKGPDRPIVEEDERVRMISQLRGVGFITLKEPGEEKWELIKLLRPDTLIATAETYTAEEIKELEEKYCERVVVLGPQATTSTSARIRRLKIGGEEGVLQAIEAMTEFLHGKGIDAATITAVEALGKRVANGNRN